VPNTVITFVAVTVDDLALLAGWFEGDVEGAAHLGFYRDGRAWLELLSKDRRGWIVHADRVPIGFLDLEADGDTGYFSYYVAPPFRGRGLGTALLLQIGTPGDEMRVRKMKGDVESGNSPSLAALRRAGFTVGADVDAEGMLSATKVLRAA
jgi:RimJ/RimL family protein N-acetyltransferase